MATTARPIYAIAADVQAHWAKVNYGAQPYLDAMFHLNTVTDAYGYDSAKSVLAYFLANAASFRGEDAKRIKAEIKALTK